MALAGVVLSSGSSSCAPRHKTRYTKVAVFISGRISFASCRPTSSKAEERLDKSNKDFISNVFVSRKR